MDLGIKVSNHAKKTQSFGIWWIKNQVLRPAGVIFMFSVIKKIIEMEENNLNSPALEFVSKIVMLQLYYFFV